MPAPQPYDQPLRISAERHELVFLSDGRAGFSMTPEAARLTLHNLASALSSFHGASTADLAPIVILVVEDEPLIREVAAVVLEDAGYQVVVAERAEEAIEALEAGATVDLLFTDIQLPGQVDGLQLARLVHDRWPAIPVLVTSGHTQAPPHGMPKGGRFLRKPYQVADVLKHIQELIAA